MRPSLSSVYGVIVKEPPGWKYAGFDKQLLELTCVEASLPGSSLGTIETIEIIVESLRSTHILDCMMTP